jgi:hypothetical protein
MKVNYMQMWKYNENSKSISEKWCLYQSSNLSPLWQSLSSFFFFLKKTAISLLVYESLQRVKTNCTVFDDKESNFPPAVGHPSSHPWRLDRCPLEYSRPQGEISARKINLFRNLSDCTVHYSDCQFITLYCCPLQRIRTPAIQGKI